VRFGEAVASQSCFQVNEKRVSSSIPALVVYVLSIFVSSRVMTLLPYGLVGVVLFLGCARGLKLVSAEDRTFLNQAIPPQLKWVSRLL
jgi:hypothetical protein